MDRGEVKEIAQFAAREVVREMTPEMFRAMLKHHGIDTEDELQAQQDFIFLRKMRVGAEKIHTRGLLMVFSALVTGLIAAGWLGFKHLVVKQ